MAGKQQVYSRRRRAMWFTVSLAALVLVGLVAACLAVLLGGRSHPRVPRFTVQECLAALAGARTPKEELAAFYQVHQCETPWVARLLDDQDKPIPSQAPSHWGEDFRGVRHVKIQWDGGENARHRVLDTENIHQLLCR